MARRSGAAGPPAAVMPGGTAPAPTTTESNGDLAELETSEEYFDEQARRAADYLERRQADVQLRDTLAQAGFTGRVWDRFAEELGRYGYAVMMAWLATGELFAQCKSRNCWPGGAPLWWEEDDRKGLANEIVAVAVKNFRQKGLIGGGWDSTRGASLKTYFIGACVYAFPNLYRDWLGEYRRLEHQAELRAHQDEEALTGNAYGSHELALIKARVWSGFQTLPNDTVRKAVLLEAMGYTKPEIAEALARSVRSIEGLLERQRRRGVCEAEGDTDD
jgi:hypothetical protein